MSEFLALLIKLPETYTDQVWTKPAGFVDHRRIHERFLSINQHKIEYRKARGQMFRGKTTYGPATLIFGKKVELYKKIEEVITLDFIFKGVIPIKETEEGTICNVDCYRAKEKHP